MTPRPDRARTGLLPPPGPATMPPPPPTAARDAFLGAVRAADLLTGTQLVRAEAAARPAATAADAARALVAAGLLTRFQAERLLAGRADGFHLGPYVILQQVGRGASGRVYKARHRTMNRPVAVKVLAAERTRAAADREWYRQRVRAAARLSHPNVVTAYDANELADRFYLVTEYVDGPDLDALVRGRGPLPVPEACELVRQAAAGLAHAHALGMAHGDVKPTNLLVTRPSRMTPEPLVKIADFGLARPGAGGAADPRADVSGLGAVLYLLLAGRPPGEETAGLDRVRADVPPGLSGLVRWMLADDPGGRPTAAEVVAGLDALAGADAVCFELPAGSAGQYSFVGGQLSGEEPVPTARPVPGASYAAYPAPETDQHPAPVAETSPWERIVCAEERSPGTEPRPRMGARSSPWVVGGVATGLLALCATSAVLLMKALGK